MKNIFKLMGLALMACTLTVACGDKDNDGDTPDNPQPQQQGLTATHGSQSFTAKDVIAIDKTSQSYVVLYAYEDANNDNSLFVQGFLESVPVTNATYESTGGDIMNWRDPSITYMDNEGVLSDDGSAANYWGISTLPSSFIENITAVDLNALTMSGNWTAQTYLVEDYVNNGLSAQGLNLTDFAGTMTNMTWTWYTGK